MSQNTNNPSSVSFGCLSLVGCELDYKDTIVSYSNHVNTFERDQLMTPNCPFVFGLNGLFNGLVGHRNHFSKMFLIVQQKLNITDKK